MNNEFDLSLCTETCTSIYYFIVQEILKWISKHGQFLWNFSKFCDKPTKFFKINNSYAFVHTYTWRLSTAYNVCGSVTL